MAFTLPSSVSPRGSGLASQHNTSQGFEMSCGFGKINAREPYIGEGTPGMLAPLGEGGSDFGCDVALRGRCWQIT